MNIKHIFQNLKAVMRPELSKSIKNEVDDSTPCDNDLVENNDNQVEIEDNIDVPVDYNCISSDFTDNMLATEMMRIGNDPANMSRKQMIEILYKQMEANKTAIQENTKIANS